MWERLRETEEDNGPIAFGGESALQEVVEDEGAARLDAVLDEGEAPRGGATAAEPQRLFEEIGIAWRRRRRVHVASPRLAVPDAIASSLGCFLLV